ncbi:MAG: glycosyltransferase family 2 protein [bacterium]
MKVSIIAPMYNEEAVIVNSIDRFVKTFARLKDTWELILVNDGSTDETLRLANEESKKYPNIKVLSYMPNRGRGRALRTGFAHAEGDFIVTTEADSSWGEEIIIRLLAELKKNEADIVVASPHRKGGGYKNVPFHRRFLSSVGNKVLGLSFGRNLTMTTGMTRGYRREIIDSLNLECDGKEIHLEIISKALALGAKIEEIPAVLEWKKEKRGKPERKSSFKAGRLIITHLLFSFNESPLLLVGTIGAGFLVIGSVIGIVMLYQYLIGTLEIVRPLIIIMVVSLIIGMQVLLFYFIATQNKYVQKQLIRIQSDILKIKRKSLNKNKDAR